MSTLSSAGSRPGSPAAVQTVAAKFAPRPETDRRPGPAARVFVTGIGSRDIDLTANITGAIAHALWQTRGGDSVANWVEAERILEQLAGISAPSSTSRPMEDRARHVPPEITIPSKRKPSRR
jgi:hypothetical protein